MRVFLLSVGLTVLSALSNVSGETLRDSCWLWGHETGAVDGTNNIWGVDVARAYYPMTEAARSMGLSSLNVVRWDRPDRAFRDSLSGLRRVTWPISGLAPVGDGKYESVGYDELADWCFKVADEMPNVVGFDLDDFFMPAAGVVSVVTAHGPRACCATRFPYRQLLELRERLRAYPRPLELRLVTYDDLFSQCDPETLCPVLEQADTITYWTWKAKNIPKMGENFARLRSLAPGKRIDIGIYLWDFGESREMPVERIREQLDTALDLWRRGEANGLVFLCSSICNRPFPSVRYVRDWLARHGDECRSPAAVRESETNAGRALSLLTRWCDAIERYQVKSPDDPHVKGSVLCPACALQHGRICDVVYPMTYLWTRTGNAKYLDCARAAVAWSRYNLTDMGGARHHNDFQGQWWGITVFSQCAVGKTLLAFGDKLPDDVRADWRTWFDLQTGFVFKALDLDGVFNVNYSAAYCEAMALAWKLTGDEKFRTKARETAAKLEAYFQPDGMLGGEKHPPTFVSPRGFRAVDIGYNAEESLPSLFHYAELVGDEAYAKKLEPLGRGILEFVLPDGGLDNSMGSRLCKWTYYGSRTSDGMLPLLADLAKRGVPGASRAIDRHLGLLDRCTSRKSGLLAGGLHYDEADEGACAHHAFAHAKSLVDFLQSGATDLPDTAELPRERPYGVREFPSFGTTLVSTEDWCASFSLNDVHHNASGTDCGGGSLTLLWSRLLGGPVLAGTMLRYSTIERENMQEQRQDRETRSLMPRIESDGLTSVADSQATGAAVKDGNAVTYRAEGFLSAEGGTRSKRPFVLAYTLDGSAVSVTAKAAGSWRYVLPVIALPSDDVRIDGCRATIRRPRGTVEVTASAPIVLERTMRGARAFTPVAGLFAAYLTVAAPADGEVSVKISVAGNAIDAARKQMGRPKGRAELPLGRGRAGARPSRRADAGIEGEVVRCR